MPTENKPEPLHARLLRPLMQWYNKVFSPSFRATETAPHRRMEKIGGLRYHDTDNPGLSHKILKKVDSFTTPSFVRKAMARFIGDRGLLIDDGAPWRYMRDLMSSIFSPKGVSTRIAPIITEETDRMVDRWLENPGKPVDAEKDLRRLTARTVMRVMFSDDIAEEQAEKIIAAASTTVESFRDPSAITKGSRVVACPVDFIGPKKKVYKEAEKKIDGILEQVIARRRARPEDLRPDDLLERLLHANDYPTGKPLTDKQIKQQLVLFIVAGHETTSVAMTFALYEALKHPEEIAKMREEIDRVTGGRNVRGEDYPKLTRVTAAFKESMRLHPSAYEMAREATQDAKIEDVEFKKGDIVHIDLRKMHYDNEYWKDPEVYRPDRFIEDRNPEGFMGFGAGPHFCIGQPMAMAEGTLALAEIFNRVNLRMAPGTELKEVSAVTMRPEGRLEVTPFPRAMAA